MAVGDEGFFCNSAGVPTASLNLCGSGVDSVAFGQAPNIDAIGFHLYPDTWIRDVAWADQFIAQHLTSAKTAGKPVYMGEFGLLEGNVRNSAYQDFTNLMLQGGGSGALFWDIVPGQPPAANAEALSSFDVQAGSPLFTTIGNFAQMMTAGQALSFPPVAGDQWAQGFFNAPVTLESSRQRHRVRRRRHRPRIARSRPEYRRLADFGRACTAEPSRWWDRACSSRRLPGSTGPRSAGTPWPTRKGIAPTSPT